MFVQVFIFVEKHCKFGSHAIVDFGQHWSKNDMFQCNECIFILCFLLFLHIILD